MRIGIDGRILATRRGMGRVLRYMLEPLLELGASDEFVLFTGEGSADDLPPAPNLRLETLRTGLVPIYEQLVLPAAALRHKPDVFWCPANTGPLRMPVPMVQTLHDVIFRHRGTLLPHSSSAYQRFGARYTDWCATRLAQTAAHVVTDSEHSADEIHSLLSVPREKITVVPLGVTLCASGDSFSESKVGITKPFLLMLGATDPRKNTRLAVDAFLASPVAQQVQLVVAGLDRAAVESYAAAAGKSIVFLEYVDDETLAGLYRRCLAFVFPSLYEGFGLPVLEAMSYGAPVLASNLTSVPEVGGDAVLYFDPRSREELTAGLVSLVSDAALGQRLAKAGKLRAQSYNWRDGAETLIKILREAAR